MTPLPPHVQAYADELLAVAPPLTPAAKRAIQALALAPRALAEPRAA
jgi:hypothetical protein